MIYLNIALMIVSTILVFTPKEKTSSFFMRLVNKVMPEAKDTHKLIN